MSNHKNPSLRILLLVGIIAYALVASLFSVMFTYSYSTGNNSRNVSVDVTVNITQSLPTVLSVIVNGGRNVSLIAGSYTNVSCNATIQDYNGGSTISNVSATFFDNVSATAVSTDDNNTHYTNSNCTLGLFDTYTRNVSCSFLVQYYANSSLWVCNVTVTDPYAFSNASRAQSATNFTRIDILLALNVTTLIDYGSLAIGDVSVPQQANITNLGNRFINVSVRGYGNSSADGLAMYCQVGNISIQYEKYNLVGGANLGLYTNLSTAATLIPSLTLIQQINDSQQVVNTSYWVLQVPPNPFGVCNGTVVFQAETP